jgi:glycosyltransferase involved in cell wall biosynthesis
VTVFIVLLKYSPGLLKEASATADMSSESNVVQLIAARQYVQMNAEICGSIIYTSAIYAVLIILSTALKELKSAGGRKSWVYLYNNHWLNPVVALLGRLSGAYGVAVACHEPRKSTANTTFRFKIRARIADAIQVSTLRLSTAVVAFSNHGVRRFEAAYPWFRGRLVEGRLIVPDPGPGGGQPRVYLCFPGRPNGSTGHERFYRIAQDLAEIHGLKLCLLHPGAASSPWWVTPRDLARDGLIADPSRLSDADIVAVFRRSKAILRLDETSTQSGTIPVAFSCATPVIVRDAPGLTEFVENGKNGVIVSSEPTADEIAEAVATLDEDRSSREQDARAAYMDLFSPAPARHWLQAVFASCA